jgi:RNA polymerase sigma factor (sigma-70 family)
MPIDVDDAIGCAFVGLVDAAHRFDPTASHSGSFMSFAYWRIRGEIIDHVRRNSLLSRTQIAGGKRARVVSLDEALSDSPDVDHRGGVTLVAPQGDHDGTIDVRAALNGLEERERFVLTALAGGATCSELAVDLGLSEPRVATIATFARAKLVRDTAA